MDDTERTYAHIEALREELSRQGVFSARIEERLRAVEDDVKAMAAGAEERFVLVSAFEPYKAGLKATVSILVSMALLVAGALITFGFSFLGGQR